MSFCSFPVRIWRPVFIAAEIFVHKKLFLSAHWAKNFQKLDEQFSARLSRLRCKFPVERYCGKSFNRNYDKLMKFFGLWAAVFARFSKLQNACPEENLDYKNLDEK